MVRLYSLSVYYKDEKQAKLLKSTHDLQTFSFFQRTAVQEFMGFASKIIVERTASATRQSVKQDAYMCHVYVRSDNLAAVLVADHEYPQRVAHTLITKILDDFSLKITPDQWDNLVESSVNFNQLPIYLSKYQDPKEADALTKIQNDIHETEIILKNTIEAILERGDKLDDMVIKSENLSIQSKAFYKTAKKTNSCCSFS